MCKKIWDAQKNHSILTHYHVNIIHVYCQQKCNDNYIACIKICIHCPRDIFINNSKLKYYLNGVYYGSNKIHQYP